MSIFDRLIHKRNRNAEQISQYSGMRLEIMDLKKRLLFVARASVSWSGGMVLQPISHPRLREDTSDYPVLLRGYRDQEKKAIHMQGRITAKKDGSWHVTGLRVTGKENERAFYRQGVALDAEIVPMRQKGVASKPCLLMDISVGGVCIRTEEEFMLGEELLLKLNLRSDGEVTPLMCSIRRGVKRLGYYEYGCEFVNMSKKAEATVTAAIMALQRKRMRRE